MQIQIKKRFDGSVLFEGDFDCLMSAVREAIFKGADLRDANLDGANLRYANLYGANLYDANLYGADLRDANLDGADLRYANLYGANLRDANLRDANLYSANLYGANLRDANLDGANLRDANLRYADLRGANLRYADLRGANLRYADLRGANLDGVKISWSSHSLISEILWRAAGETESRQMLAAYVGRRTDWCWDKWSAWQHPERAWALAELSEWITNGDDAPECVRAEQKETRDRPAQFTPAQSRA